jgi:hypothetical protein
MHLTHDGAIEEGIAAECDPDWLEVVEYGLATPDDVRTALDTLGDA